MALRHLLQPWDAQPAERIPPDFSLASWGTMVAASSWPVELVNQAPVAQLNGTYRVKVSPSRVGPAIVPVGNSGVAAATWMPSPDMGAIIGASLLWHGVITAASGSSTTTGLVGRYSTTSGGAGYVGQFFLRVTTAGKIALEVNNGAGPVAYTTGLTVVYGEPLTILVRFTVAGADIISSVGSESVSIPSMAATVGIYTPGIFASIGADRWNYTGHPYQQTALAAWARTHIPAQVVREPWSVLEPQRLMVAASTPSGGTTYEVTVTEAGSASDAGSTVLSATAAAVEAAAASDAILASVVAMAERTESASAADAIAAQAAIVVTLTEAGSAADAANWGGAIYSAETVETTSAADAVSRVLQAAEAVAEAGSAGDTLAAVMSLTDATVEPAAALDALAVALQLGAQLAETGDAADGVTGGTAAIVSVDLAESGAALDVLIAIVGDIAVMYPLAGIQQAYPGAGSAPIYPLAGAAQDYPLAGVAQN